MQGSEPSVPFCGGSTAAVPVGPCGPPLDCLASDTIAQLRYYSHCSMVYSVAMFGHLGLMVPVLSQRVKGRGHGAGRGGEEGSEHAASPGMPVPRNAA